MSFPHLEKKNKFEALIYKEKKFRYLLFSAKGAVSKPKKSKATMKIKKYIFLS